MNAAINIGVEDMMCSVVKFGLYVGAFFQLMCIFACIILPDSSNDDNSAWKNVNKLFVIVL